MAKYLIAATLVITFLSFAFSQNSEDTLQLETYVVSAQYIPKSEKNSMYKVKVINAKTIQHKGVNNLGELLRQEVSINMIQNSVFGASLEIQGISKENIKILIDGIPVIGRLNGVIDLSQIDLSNIQQVEIIEGPVSVFYGTDAMGGIINLITKKNQKKKIEGSVIAFYESINAAKINGNIAYKKGKNRVQLGLGSYRFYGFSTNDDIRHLNWEKKNQEFFNLSYSRKLNHLKLLANTNFSNEKLMSFGEEDASGTIVDKDYFTRRIDNVLHLKGKILRNKYLESSFSYLDYQRYHNTYNVDNHTLESTLAEADNKEDNLVKFNYMGVKTQLAKSEINKKLNYLIGFDLSKESSSGERILDQKQSIQTYALFSSINYRINSALEIQPAVRLTNNSSYGSLISPAFNTKFDINKNTKLRFSYARGFRAPSIKELYLDFHIKAGPFTYTMLGNTDLEVEKSHSFNLQLSHTQEITHLDKITMSSFVFYNKIDNLIALSEMVNFKRHYININKFESIGGNINISYSNTKDFTCAISGALIGRYNKFTEDYDAERFLFSPEVSSTINYHIKWITSDINVFYKYTGKRSGFVYNQETNDLIETTRNDYQNMDISLSKSFFNKMVKASTGVKNIFDVQDIETFNQVGEAHSRNMQLWGRTFFIKIAYYF